MNRTERGRFSIRVLAVLLVGAVAATPVATAKSDDAKPLESYTAIAMNVASGGPVKVQRLIIKITAWSTDEQRAALLKVLEEKGSFALVDALRDQPVVGTVRAPGSLAYDLHYARATQQGDTRHLILGTDRPIGFVEAMRGARSLDKGVTMFHIALGADGKGKGELLVGAELALDPETKELTVEHLGAQPWKLNDVEPNR